jgi:hypothetical protein
MQANQHRPAFRCRQPPASTAFASTRRDFVGCPYRSKGAILAVRPAEIRRKSVKIPGTNCALFTERLGEPE